MKNVFVIIFVFLFSINTVFASTGGEVEYDCPLCGTAFDYWVQFSFSIFGQNLDFRRWGAAIIPSPIPKCPDCSFVFDNNLFTEAEIEILGTELSINNIFENEPNMPNYFYLARQYEILSRDIVDIAWFFLNSVWENRNEDRNTFLINTTIEYINRVPQTNEVFNNFQLIKLDLLRRSGQFFEANNLINAIMENKNLYTGFIVDIINLQRELIENRNQEEHGMPDNR
ncbi:MAG: hypothetical protein FWD82_10315 [Defluviitaleaceae bacterium]|nr:hypothetical protein [Defluviitaleaceae bacterium]